MPFKITEISRKDRLDAMCDCLQDCGEGTCLKFYKRKKTYEPISERPPKSRVGKPRDTGGFVIGETDEDGSTVFLSPNLRTTIDKLG